MIKLDDSRDSFYLCNSANWFTVVKAECQDDAAKKALELVINELDDEADVSPCIRVKKIKEKLEDSDYLIRIDKVFSDMGMYKESRSMTEILKNLNR